MTTPTQLAQEYFDILQANPIFDDTVVDRFDEILEAAEQDPELAELLAKIDYDYARQTVTPLEEKRLKAMRQRILAYIAQHTSEEE